MTWGVLETLLGWVGYRLLRQRRSPSRSLALTGWGVTLAGLAGFNPVFFGTKRLGASTAVATAMLASSSATAVTAGRDDPSVAVAMTPLVLWTGFAVLLSEEFWRRN